MKSDGSCSSARTAPRGACSPRPSSTGSAGLAPDPVVAPAVAAALFAEGVNVSGLRPRRVTPEELAAAWRVVALGCDPGALAPPGVEVLRWDDVPSPSEHYTAARDLLAGRIAELLAP